MSTPFAHQTKPTSEQSMPDPKISNTYTSIIKYPSSERLRPSSLDMSIKKAAKVPSQTEPQKSPPQHIATLDVKRPRELLFEPRKKAKLLLERSNGKSVNHFSQSARILQSRPSATLLNQPSSRSILTKSSLPKQAVFKINPEAMTLAGKPSSKSSSSSSASSRLSTFPVPSDGTSLSTNSDSTSTTLATATAKAKTKAPAAARTLEHPRLSSHKSEPGSTSLIPQPIRSLTFSGPVSISGIRSSKMYSSESPFSGSPFMSGGSTPRTSSSKSAHSVATRLSRSQSLLRQTTLATSFLDKPETHAVLPTKQPSDLSEETPWMPTKTTNKIEKPMRVIGSLDQELSDENEDEEAVDKIVDELEVGSSLGIALESCTAAMTALSPPSAKKTTKALISSSLRMLYQPSFVTEVPKPASLSLPNADFESAPFGLSDDDNHDQVSDERSSGQEKASRPHATHKSRSSSSISTNTKRPIMWRRHQTMISSRSEFMKTLETNNVATKKSLVLVSDTYIPDPLREECQILPSTHFNTKPDDTTQRVSPKTVVDVLEGKYEDQYDVLHIIDCRFPYEFEGGHIKSAVNINTTDELDKLLLQPATTDKRVLLIFHCEFSSKRAPRLARHLRNQDRAWNVSHYPALFYPEVYVMEGGYSSFFEENKSYCWPEAYVKM
ncbi:cell division cycle- protein [Mortierella sp. 14UC]|nr:cell division cycle- protein [Mortierella sp. 14UC]